MKLLFVQKMSSVSGSELYLMQLLPELKKRGYEVQVLIIFPVVPEKVKPLKDHFAEHKIVVHEIYGHKALSPVLLGKINKLIKQEGYDIVQSNLVHADLWLAMVKCFFRRKMKLVSVKHGFDEAFSARYGNNPRHLWKSLFFWSQKISGWFADYNVTISKGLYDMYAKGRIVSRKRLRNIYYGLDLKEKESLVVNRPPAERFAVILGRLVKYKGHELLLKAWQEVAKHHPDWKLYIIGGGNYENQLRSLTQELQLGNSVKFCGYQANPHQFIKDSEFMLVTSIWEGFGLIMLESWVHKKPVIAFDVPAMNEVITPGKTGLLARPFDTDELAKSILSYFENPSRVADHGAAGYDQLYSYYTVSRMADETCEVYEQVAAGGL